MKNNQFTSMLLVLMLLSTLISVWLMISYNLAAQKLRQLGPELNAANNARSIIQSILTDTVEYSKTHPDINRVLQPYFSPTKPAPATAPVKPAK